MSAEGGRRQPGFPMGKPAFFLSQWLSTAGDAAYIIAVGCGLRAQGPELVAAFLACLGLPRALSPLTAFLPTPAFEAARLLAAVDALRGLLSLATIVALSRSSFFGVIALATASQLLGGFSRARREEVLGTLGFADDLRLVSVWQAGHNAAAVLGAPLAALLVGRDHFGRALLFDAMTFFAAAAGFALLPRAPGPAAPAPDRRPPLSPRTALSGHGGFYGTMLILNVLPAFVTSTVLIGTSDAPALSAGLLMALWTAACIVGALALPLARLPVRLLLVPAVLLPFLVPPLLAAGRGWSAAAVTALGGLLSGFLQVAMRQRAHVEFPRAEIGRAWGLVMVVGGLGYALGGACSTLPTAALPFLGAALAGLAVSFQSAREGRDGA